MDTMTCVLFPSQFLIRKNLRIEMNVGDGNVIFNRYLDTINESHCNRLYTMSNGLVVKLLHLDYKTSYHAFFSAKIIEESNGSRLKKNAFIHIREDGRAKNYSFFIHKEYFIPLKNKLNLL
jgi:hypothetical protein